MTKKTIDELPPGETLRTSAAVVAFEQSNVTFKGSITPLAPNAKHVRNQAQLEAELNSNLEIADGDKITIVVDESFVLTKGFKLGLGSVLEMLRGSAEVTLTTTTLTEPVFSLTNPANPCRALLVDGVFFVGDGTQSLCKLQGTSRVFMEDVRAQQYLGAETEFPFLKLNSFAPVEWARGWLIRDASIVQIFQSNIRQFTDNGITLYSFILGNPGSIAIESDAQSSLFASESLLYFDSNADPGMVITIDKTSISLGDFYQLGADLAISAVEDDGNGKLRLESLAHGLTKDQVMVLSGFSESTYNKTAFVKVFDASRLDVEEITFVPGLDSGNVNGTSLDATDNKINAVSNPGQRDSMSLAEGRSMNPISYVASGTIEREG